MSDAVFLLISCLLAACSSSNAAANPVEKASCCSSGLVKVSCFGYAPEDSTAAFQAALDCDSADTISVDARIWIVEPLQLTARAKPLTIRFEAGAVVEAKKGAFRDPQAALMAITGANHVTLTGNATLRMQAGCLL